MKKILFLTYYLFVITSISAQKVPDYPFEITLTGQGERNIILIPGFACSGDVWAETTSIFKKNYRCHVLTMAGFAGVAPVVSSSFESWKIGIISYIKEQKIKPIIIGHSMGGGLAMAIAADYPELIEKIISVDALPCLAAFINSDFRPIESKECNSIKNSITSLSKEAFYQMQKRTMLQLIQNTTQLETVLQWSVTSDRHTFATLYCDYLNTDLRNSIATIKCPTLILLEANFKHFNDAIDAQFKNIHDADIRYATKGLHFIMYDDKTWYLKQLTNFLENN